MKIDRLTIILLLILVLNNIIVLAKDNSLPNDLFPKSTDIVDFNDIQDKESCSDRIPLDTINIKLPYASIKDRQLKKLINTLQVTTSDGKHINTPVFLYMTKRAGSTIEWWIISPYLGLDENFYNTRAIAFYKTGQIYVMIDRSLKNKIRIIPNEKISFSLLTNQELAPFNIEPIFEIDVRLDRAKSPILSFGNNEINWFNQYKVE